MVHHVTLFVIAFFCSALAETLRLIWVIGVTRLYKIKNARNSGTVYKVVEVAKKIQKRLQRYSYVMRRNEE